MRVTTETTNSYCRHYSTAISQSKYPNRKEATGISREQFCRKAIQGVAIRENPPVDLYKLIWEIRRVGNNINQILMIANAKGILNIPDLRKAIDDLREVEKLIFSQYI